MCGSRTALFRAQVSFPIEEFSFNADLLDLGWAEKSQSLECQWDVVNRWRLKIGKGASCTLRETMPPCEGVSGRASSRVPESGHLQGYLKPKETDKLTKSFSWSWSQGEDSIGIHLNGRLMAFSNNGYMVPCGSLRYRSTLLDDEKYNKENKD